MSDKISKKRPLFRLNPACAALLLAFTIQTTQANPIGAAVVNGQASFATTGNALTVTNTPGAIINWQGFSIGANEITRFAQQSASSAVLNRVISNNPSSILGSLQSNGRVFLVNPNGIVFGQGATVNVAGMVASTLNLSNADFLAGRYNFTNPSPTGGVAGVGVSNAGNITAHGDGLGGGQIYLIAANVENTGIIKAPNGEILLAAGHSVELVNSNEPNLRVNITAPAGDATNVGKLVAEAGSLGLFGAVVRNSGTVSADSATLQGGKIVFKASQRTEISGTVTADGMTGGTIQALGNQVGIMDGATVTANGTQGGGTILVGGDYQGKNPDVQNAQVTYVAPTATISADATLNGNGGKVIVWSDDTTRAYSNISAHGGANGGDGGFVEASGKRQLDFKARIDTSAPKGKPGTVLLDPDFIVIANGSGGADDGQIGGADGDIFATDGGAVTFTISEQAIEGLQTGTVLLQAAKNITLNDLTTNGILLLDPLVTIFTLETTASGSSEGITFINPLNEINSATGATINLTAGGSGSLSNIGKITSTGGGLPGIIALTSANSIDLKGAITAFGGDFGGSVNLVAGVGGVTSDINGVITASGGGAGGALDIISAGSVMLGAVNSISRLTASITGGNISLANDSLIYAAPLTITGISLSSGGTVNIINTVSIDASGPIISDGDVNLIAGWNGTGMAVTSGTGNITFGAGSSISTSGNLYFNAGNSVSQSAGATITANTLGIGNTNGTSLPGGINLPETNMVNTLAVQIDSPTGSLIFSNGKTLTIGAATYTSGIVASGNPSPINITTTVGNLTIAQPIVSDVLGGSPITLSAAGILNLNAAVTSTNNGTGAGPVVLQAGAGGVTSNTSGIITAAGLKVVSGGSVTLTANNAIDILAGTSVSSFQFANSKGFAVNTAGGDVPLSGLVATTGDITLKSGLLNASLNIFQPVTASAGNVTYIADNMDLAALTTAAVIAQVKPFTAATNIDLGGTDAAGTLGLTAAELSQFTANILRVGDLLNTASIYVSAPISPANTTTLSLLSGGGVTQAGGGTITESNLVIQAKGNVALDITSNMVGSLAGSITGTGAEYFHIINSGNLVIDTVDGVAGISIANFPSYSAGSSNGVISLLATAGITQTATGGLGGAAVWAVSNGGSVNLTTKTGGNATGIIAGSAYSGFSYRSSSPIALMNVAGNSGITTTMAGNIDIAGSEFSNSLATPFTITGGGRWLVYAPSPANVTKGGLTSSFRQYNTAYGGNVPQNGNGFIYASAPGALSVNTTLSSGAASNNYGTAPTAVFGYAIGNPSIADNEDLVLIAGTPTFMPALSSTTPAGGYTVSYSCCLASAAGYTFALGTGLAYTVNPAPITIINIGAALTGTASKTYDGTTNAALTPGNFLLSGFVNTDFAIVTKTAGTYASPNVGSGIMVSTTLVPSDFSPVGATNLANYTLPTSASGLIGSITPASLTVTANSASKVYNGQPYSGGNGVSYTGLVNGETSSVLGNTLTYGGTSQGAVNAGSYLITPGGLTSGNYTIGYVDGILTINPATMTLLSVAATNASKTYGTTLTFTGSKFTPVGLLNGDTIGSVTLASPGAVNTANVGAYAITLSNAVFSIGKASNYTISYVDGQLTITPAALTVTANPASKVYNGQPYSGGNGVSYTGLVNGETAAVLGGALTYGGTSQGAVNAGSYLITPGGLTNSNYAINYADGSLTVSAAPLTVTANPASKVYDGLRYSGGNGVTYTGLVNGETAAVLGGSLTYGGTSQGAVNAGSYLITPGGLSNGNYAINYADGALTISPLAIKLALSGNKVYDGTTTFSTKQLTVSNAVSGDVVNLSAGTADTTDKNVGVDKPFFSFTDLTLSGTAAGNYTLTGVTGSGIITVRPLSTWSGKGSDSLWSNPLNWDALPDGSNVLAVSILGDGNVTYDVVATTLQTLTSAGNLVLNNNFSVGAFNQSGGSLTGTGNLNVSNSFNQTGGMIGLTGTAIANINQAAGNLNIANLSAPTVNLTASAGAITQTGPIVAAKLTTQSVTGTTLTDTGNRIGLFSASNSSGDIKLLNTSSPLILFGIVNNGGAITVENTGGIRISRSIKAPKGKVEVRAHSPITIDSSITADSIELVAGVAGSPTTADIITLNAPISGSSIVLAAHSVTGSVPAPAGATLQIYTEPVAAKPAVIDTLVSNIVVLPPIVPFSPPTPPALVQTPTTDATTTDGNTTSTDEKKKDAPSAKEDEVSLAAAPAPAAAPMPVCK